MAHVPHLYIPGPWGTDTLLLDPDHLHHLTRVLRIGDERPVSYTDGAGRVGRGRLEGASIVRGEERSIDRTRVITVAVAPPDSRERARFLVEKLAELGVARLVWLETTRGQGRPPRTERTVAWAVGALEQSRGGWLMESSETMVAMDALPRPLLVAAPGGDSAAPKVTRATVAVGPEGGWAPDEIPADAICIDLGPTILRVETAAIVAATMLR